MQNVKCKMQNVKCLMQRWKCKILNEKGKLYISQTYCVPDWPNDRFWSDSWYNLGIHGKGCAEPLMSRM